jgi:hypothetical protein
VIAPEWKRLCGIHVTEDGLLAAVWVAHDTQADVIHLYDCCVFRREVMAVIAEGMAARGRWIPIAWDSSAKDMTDKLLERGLSPLPDGYKYTDASAEMTARDVWERLRSGRLKVEKRLGEWQEEAKSYTRSDSKVPRGSHPLMAATHHAIARLDWAKRQAPKRGKNINFPKVPIL